MNNSILTVLWRPESLEILGCVCVVFPFILDVRLVDVPAGVTQDFSSIFILRFSREKDLAVPFPRRP